jgi:hypothetical protein
MAENGNEAHADRRTKAQVLIGTGVAFLVPTVGFFAAHDAGKAMTDVAAVLLALSGAISGACIGAGMILFNSLELRRLARALDDAQSALVTQKEKSAIATAKRREETLRRVAAQVATGSALTRATLAAEAERKAREHAKAVEQEAVEARTEASKAVRARDDANEAKFLAERSRRDAEAAQKNADDAHKTAQQELLRAQAALESTRGEAVLLHQSVAQYETREKALEATVEETEAAERAVASRADKAVRFRRSAVYYLDDRRLVIFLHVENRLQRTTVNLRGVNVVVTLTDFRGEVVLSTAAIIDPAFTPGLLQPLEERTIPCWIIHPVVEGRGRAVVESLSVDGNCVVSGGAWEGEAGVRLIAPVVGDSDAAALYAGDWIVIPTERTKEPPSCPEPHTLADPQ